MSNMENITITIIILTMVANSSECFLYTMQYKQLQGDSTLSGMACAMARRETVRSFEFDTADGTCASLGTAWFSSPTTQPGHNYFELTEFAYHLEQNKSLVTHVPENFRLGDSIVLYLKKEASAVGVVSVRFDLFDGDGVLDRWGPTDHIYIHIDNQMFSGILNFNAFVNGSWAAVQQLPDPFNNGTGKLEVIVMASEFLVYVDDNNVYNYTSYLPVPHNLFFIYQGLDTECTRVQYLYEN